MDAVSGLIARANALRCACATLLRDCAVARKDFADNVHRLRNGRDGLTAMQSKTQETITQSRKLRSRSVVAAQQRRRAMPLVEDQAYCVRPLARSAVTYVVLDASEAVELIGTLGDACEVACSTIEGRSVMTFELRLLGAQQPILVGAHSARA